MKFRIQQICSSMAFVALFFGNQAVAQLETVKQMEQAYGFAKGLYADIQSFAGQDYEIYKNEVVLSWYREERTSTYRDVPNYMGSKVVAEAFLSPLGDKTTSYNTETTEYNPDGTPKPSTRSDKAFLPREGCRDQKCGNSPFTRSTSKVETTYRLNNIVVQKAKNPKKNGVDNHCVVLVVDGLKTWTDCVNGTEEQPKKWEISLSVGREGYKEFAWTEADSRVPAKPSVFYTKKDIVAIDLYGQGYSTLTKDRRDVVDQTISRGGK